MSTTDVQVSVPVRYTRSIHIQRDFSNDRIGVRDYQATPLVIETTGRIMASLQPDSTLRAFSLIGPYGAGKSAYGVFLAHYLWSDPHTRRTLLADHATDGVPEPAPVEGPQLLPLIISGNNESLCYSLIRGLRNLFERYSFLRNRRNKLLRVVEAAVEQPDLSPQQIAALIAQTCAYAAQQSEFRGIIILIDELGQFLNFAARQGQERDLFVLQALAEMAARSGETPCVVMTILHQAFDRYAGTAGLAQRTEWAKVQGRFVELPFQEPPTQLLRMVGRALCPNLDHDPHRTIRQQWSDQIAPLANELGLRPPDLSIQEWPQLLARAYPLHPAVLVALPQLFRQLAQNERSLFAFLTSPEPFSVPDVLRAATETDSLPIYRLSHLYEYIHANLGASLFGRARGQRWAELAEALAQLGDSNTLTTQILTVIGTLGALGQSYGLRANLVQICFALCDQIDHPMVTEGLEALIRRKLITYRRHRDSYIVWEGSDLDLEGMIQEVRTTLSGRMMLIAMLRQHADTAPLIARRHSYRTGATRTFAVHFEDISHLTPDLLISLNADGELLYVVPTDDTELAAALAWATDPVREFETQRVVVLPRCVRELRELLLDVAALRDVLYERPELESDGAARREVSSRLIEAQQALTQLIAETYGPGFSRWFRRGTEVSVQTPRQVDDLLSLACDETFSATPRIWNELIMRRQPSAAAVKARRNLVEALLERQHIAGLGLSGYPPERAMYESVLHSSGIHRQGANGAWQIGSPPTSDPLNLLPTWKEMERWLNEASTEPRPLNDLYAAIAVPPYGVKMGLVPLLFATLYVARAGEIVIYERGNYAPFPDVALFDRLLTRPESFAVRLSRADGARYVVYERLAQRLAPQALTQSVQPALLAVSLPLLKIFHKLPDYSRRAQRISKQAQAIRVALREARAPDELLFEHLPTACGIEPFAADDLPEEQRINRFFEALSGGLQELQGSYQALVDHLRECIYVAFNASATDSQSLRAEIQQRYELIAATTGDLQLRALGVRLETATDGDAWVESIAALIAKRPPDTWSDGDINTFESGVAELGRRLHNAEQIAVANRIVSPDASVLRIGIANGKGEHSRVIRRETPDAAMERLREQLRTVLAEYATLTAEQRAAVLAELIEPLLIEQD